MSEQCFRRQSWWDLSLPDHVPCDRNWAPHHLDFPIEATPRGSQVIIPPQVQGSLSNAINYLTSSQMLWRKHKINFKNLLQNLAMRAHLLTDLGGESSRPSCRTGSYVTHNSSTWDAAFVERQAQWPCLISCWVPFGILHSSEPSAPLTWTQQRQFSGSCADSVLPVCTSAQHATRMGHAWPEEKHCCTQRWP